MEKTEGRKFEEATDSMREALVRLASIDPMELCNEAKVERCRATRDLRSCGRCIQRVFILCGHAALCDECCQRCDVCPICRITLGKGINESPLRLYYKCIEAGLISKRYDDRLQDKEEGENRLIADVQRLYSLFDVALENNLASVICHYVTDVCMDESAVSSDPVIAFLLDEKVVKDWCRRTFISLLEELKTIYNLTTNEMNEKLHLLLRVSSKLIGIISVLEVLESSFKHSVSAMLQDLNHLQENTLKTKQHLEMMIWCIKHRFLENVKSRYSDLASWRSAFGERKSAAITRAWPDSTNTSSEFGARSLSSLFIEDALSNLDTEEGNMEKDDVEIAITSLRKDGGSLFFRSKLHGMAVCYPFESLRAAVDLLFLQGNSDVVVAKEAIFLYYLFDRHWTIPIEEWRPVIDDFAGIFNINRHSLFESFAFYLSDDHSDEALQAATALLPEIACPSTHPKVARILLEREYPDAALMVLRWSGQDHEARPVSLEDAITVVRVRVECALLTEAFTYQRMMVTKVKDKKLTIEYDDDGNDQPTNWLQWMEPLVTEICCLCIRRNLVAQMIELPWNPDEEKYLHKCLFDFAMDDPLSIIGSLLIVFYLQRFRYAEAYRVDSKLQAAEAEFLSKNRSEEIAYKMNSMTHWRKGLVSRSVELLPDTLQQQLKSGLPESAFIPSYENIPVKPNLPKLNEPILSNLLFKVPQSQWQGSNGFVPHH